MPYTKFIKQTHPMHFRLKVTSLVTGQSVNIDSEAPDHITALNRMMSVMGDSHKVESICCPLYCPPGNRRAS